MQKKHDSPVMVAAPRRVERAKDNDTEYADNGAADAPAKEDEGENIELVRAALVKKNPWDDWKDDTPIFNSQVAATVNGAPILNGDILDRYTDHLLKKRNEWRQIASDPEYLKSGKPIPTPADYEMMRYQIIQGNLVGYIQKKLLVEHLISGMKPEQKKMMNNHVDEMFEKEFEKLKLEHNVSNRTELELALNKKGTTLQNVKDNFTLDRLSMECLMVKSKKPAPVERPDMVAYYQSNREKFAITPKVKWEQIQVSTPQPPTDANKKAAKQKLEQAIAELNNGTPFDKVARTYSDGPTAKDGGAWDWLEEGNLADKKLETKLFSLPVDELSEIHEGPAGLCVVRVTEKQEAGFKPFSEVQDEIRETLEKEQRGKSPKKFLSDVFSRAFIETQYSLNGFQPEE